MLRRMSVLSTISICWCPTSEDLWENFQQERSKSFASGREIAYWIEQLKPHSSSSPSHCTQHTIWFTHCWYMEHQQKSLQHERGKSKHGYSVNETWILQRLQVSNHSSFLVELRQLTREAVCWACLPSVDTWPELHDLLDRPLQFSDLKDLLSPLHPQNPNLVDFLPF
jgi:hypothetical protein